MHNVFESKLPVHTYPDSLSIQDSFVDMVNKACAEATDYMCEFGGKFIASYAALFFLRFFMVLTCHSRDWKRTKLGKASSIPLYETIELSLRVTVEYQTSRATENVD